MSANGKVLHFIVINWKVGKCIKKAAELPVTSEMMQYL